MVAGKLFPATGLTALLVKARSAAVPLLSRVEYPLFTFVMSGV